MIEIANVGPVCFGAVVGWVTYRTLRRREGRSGLSDIAAVIGAVGGGAVTVLFPAEGLFNLYSIGLFVGFFGYFLVGLFVEGKPTAGKWMGD